MKAKKTAAKRRNKPARAARRVRNSALPALLCPLFWEYDAAALRWPRDRETIIPKILQVGTWAQIGWLRQNIGDSGVRAWIGTHRGGGLSAPQLYFWNIVAGIEKRRIKQWLKERGPNPWARRTSA